MPKGLNEYNQFIPTNNRGRMVDINIRMTQAQFGSLNAVARVMNMPTANRSELIRFVLDVGFQRILAKDFAVVREKELRGEDASLDLLFSAKDAEDRSNETAPAEMTQEVKDFCAKVAEGIDKRKADQAQKGGAANSPDFEREMLSND